MSCGCDEPRRSIIVKCPIALNNKIEHCEGLGTSSSILGDVPCEKCEALIGGSNADAVGDTLAAVPSTIPGRPTFLRHNESIETLSLNTSPIEAREVKDGTLVEPLQFDAPPEEIKDDSEKEILTETVEKIVEFVEETRDVEITHHHKPTGHVLEHGESVTLRGIVTLDESTSAEVKIKVTKD